MIVRCFSQAVRLSALDQLTTLLTHGIAVATTTHGASAAGDAVQDTRTGRAIRRPRVFGC